MTMKKILLACACAGLLAIGATPGLAAGPMMSGTRDQTVNGDAVQKVEYRGDRRHFYSPRSGYGHWRNRHYYSPRYGHGHWGHRHYQSPRYGHGHWGQRQQYSPRHGYRGPHPGSNNTGSGNYGDWR
jgi:hypothetical protein